MEEKSDSIGIAVAAGIELAKLAIQIYFKSLEMAGKTELEIDAMYQVEKDYFAANRPETLPDMEIDEEDNG